MTVNLRDIVELQPTQHWRRIGGQFFRDHVARLADGRRVLVWLPDGAAA